MTEIPRDEEPIGVAALDRCRALLAPRSIAVIGASDRPGPGQRVVSNLVQAGFAGALYPINPGRDQVGGIPAYPSLDALQEPPNLAVVAVNREASVEAVAAAAEWGTAAAILLGAGFGETDQRGRELDQRLRALRGSIALMGPNCLGYVNLQARIAPYSGPLMEPLTAGNVALVSNSGALACTLTGAAAERGIQFSHVITTGNQIDLTVADYVHYLAHQVGVRAIACYVEGFQDGRALLAAFDEARAQERMVILLKAGRSRLGGEAGRTHTGALAGSASIQDGLWREHGLLLAEDLEEFLALIELGSRAPVPAGPRLGVITISGGERLLLADRAEALGLQLASLSHTTRDALHEILPVYAAPSNPLDSTGAGLVERNGQVHAAAARLLAQDPSVDLLLVCQDIKNGWVQADHSGTLFWDAIRATWEAVAAVGKPVVVVSPTTGQVDERARTDLHDHDIPMLFGLKSGLDALAKFIGLHHGGAPSPEVETVPVPVQTGGTRVSGYEALGYLEAKGLPVWPTENAWSEEDAVAAATRLGYPVALKLDAPGLLHRAERGGVRLHVRTDREVRQAWRELTAVDLGGGVRPSVLVQAMAPPGVELFVGGLHDEQFGPVVMMGAGGTLAEFVRDVEAALAPLDVGAAGRLADATRVNRLLNGWRGGTPVDRQAVLEALVAISRVIESPEVMALDVNPLIALPEGVALVDAKLVLREQSEHNSPQ